MPDHSPSTDERASLAQPSQSSSPLECTSHLGYSLGGGASAQVVVAEDAWTRELARNTPSDNTPTIFCTPDGQCTPAVELRT